MSHSFELYIISGQKIGENQLTRAWSWPSRQLILGLTEEEKQSWKTTLNNKGKTTSQAKVTIIFDETSQDIAWNVNGSLLSLRCRHLDSFNHGQIKRVVGSQLIHFPIRRTLFSWSASARGGLAYLQLRLHFDKIWDAKQQNCNLI